jgi:hypothetical protein
MRMSTSFISSLQPGGVTILARSMRTTRLLIEMNAILLTCFIISLSLNRSKDVISYHKGRKVLEGIQPLLYAFVGFLNLRKRARMFSTPGVEAVGLSPSRQGRTPLACQFTRGRYTC